MLLLGMSRTEAFLATCTDVLPLLHHLNFGVPNKILSFTVWRPDFRIIWEVFSYCKRGSGMGGTRINNLSGSADPCIDAT